MYSFLIGSVGCLALASTLGAQGLDSFSRRLGPDGSPLVEELRRQVETLSGRIALEERLLQLDEELRAKRWIEATSDAANLRISEWGPPIEWEGVGFPENLESYRERVASLRALLVEVAGELPTEPSLHARYREFLLSERAAHLFVRHESLRENPRAHLDWMTFIEKDGVRLINPHARGRLRAELDAFEEEWAELRALIDGDEARLDLEGEEGLGPSSRAERILFLSLFDFLSDEMVDVPAAWLDEHFRAEGELLVLREEAAGEIESLLARTERRSAELEASPPPIVLDPAALEYESEKLDLLRSSTFFNPRTMRGWELYNEEYEDHVAARIFGVFDWVVGNSKSFEQAVEKLRQRNVWAPSLGPTHRKVIVYIAAVPRWLSSSADGEGFQGDGGWQHFKAHSPKEWEPWRELVRETVRLFEDIDERCEMYYEVWNEPDGEYWREDTAAFLRMYEETVRAVREVDPEAKVGGTAVNQWNGKLRADPEADYLNLELIRFARKHDVPLDFVSWHHFGQPKSALKTAVEVYTKEFEAQGYDPFPELLITEWSIPYRGTTREAVSMAEMMRAIFESKVDAQTISAWEEFGAAPNPRHFSPWGMITQQGHLKPQYHVHRFFDTFGRGSTGVATIEVEGKDRFDGATTVMVSREEDGTLELLLWRTGYDAPMAAALGHLTEAGMADEDYYPYRSLEQLERSIREGKALDEKWQAAFEHASELFREVEVAGVPIEWTVLEFGEGQRVELVEAESVRMSPDTPVIVPFRSQLALRPARYAEVIRLRVRIGS